MNLRSKRTKERSQVLAWDRLSLFYSMTFSRCRMEATSKKRCHRACSSHLRIEITKAVVPGKDILRMHFWAPFRNFWIDSGFEALESELRKKAWWFFFWIITHMPLKSPFNVYSSVVLVYSELCIPELCTNSRIFLSQKVALYSLAVTPHYLSSQPMAATNLLSVSGFAYLRHFM